MKLTTERMAAFCAALAATGGNVTRACAAIDVARITVYKWRDQDPDFAEQWDRAKAIGLEGLEDEALRRAYEGTAEPVFHMGLQCGTIQKYSDTLAIFLLKGGKPDKYRENSKVELGGRLELARMSDEELDQQLEDLLLAERAAQLPRAPAAPPAEDDLASYA